MFFQTSKLGYFAQNLQSKKCVYPLLNELENTDFLLDTKLKYNLHSDGAFEQHQTKHNIIPTNNLIKQNRILINFKKLNHFENCFLRSKTFLRKNFDLIHSQIKATNESTKTKSIPFTHFLSDNLSICEMKNENNSRFYKSSTILQKELDRKILEKRNKFIEKKNKKLKKIFYQLTFKNGIKSNNKYKNKNKETVVQKNINDSKKKYDFKTFKSEYKCIKKKLDELNNLIENNSNSCQNNYHILSKIVSSNFKLNSQNSIYTAKEFLTFKSPISTKQELNKFEIRKQNIKNKQIYDKKILIKNELKISSIFNKNQKDFKIDQICRRYINFSRNMIEFTLNLHKVLYKIDRVNFIFVYKI